MSAIDFYIGICLIISNAWEIAGKGNRAIFWSLMVVALVVVDFIKG